MNLFEKILVINIIDILELLKNGYIILIYKVSNIEINYLNAKHQRFRWFFSSGVFKSHKKNRIKKNQVKNV